MNCRGTDPPTTLSTNSNPPPVCERLDLEVADGVLAVAAALLDVPALARWPAGERLAQRHPDVDLVDLDAVPVARAGRAVRRHAPRPCTTARAERLRVVLDPHGRVLGREPLQCRPSLSSSAFACATTAMGSSGSGIDHGSITSGLSLSLSVSPVSARDSFAIAQMSPAMHDAGGPLGLAERRRQGADALVLVVVLVAASAP